MNVIYTTIITLNDYTEFKHNSTNFFIGNTVHFNNNVTLRIYDDNTSFTEKDKNIFRKFYQKMKFSLRK